MPGGPSVVQVDDRGDRSSTRIHCGRLKTYYWTRSK